jgi:hypothetical protein
LTARCYKHQLKSKLILRKVSRAKSWKCDQWDGLVRLLVDEGIITQDK